MISFNKRPDAHTLVSGVRRFANTKGTIEFYEVYDGVLIVIELYGLDLDLEKRNLRLWKVQIGKDCMISILSCEGTAWMSLYMKKMYFEDLLGEMVEIYSNVGEEIAYGMIVTL